MATMKTRTHREIGELFNVAAKTVSYLSSAAKRSKPVISKRKAKELQRAHKQAAVVSVVASMIRERKSIWSANQIQAVVKE